MLRHFAVERIYNVGDANRIGELLGLRLQPVAVSFQPTPPEGVAKIDAAAVASCSYWKLAANGQAFYTDAADHLGCPIGAHTHGIEKSDQLNFELESVVGTMVQLQYINMEEVPHIPQLPGPFGVAVYAPLSNATPEPAVVIVTGTAKQIMLLAEAAHAAGLMSDSSMVGRPTCAAIPAVIQSEKIATNLGCIGNRVYTDMPDDELYFVCPGQHLEKIEEKLLTILDANRALESYHAERNTA
jgi:uncharacterized protein (DUF169 family)